VFVGEREGWLKRKEAQLVDKCVALALAELGDEAPYF